MVSKLYQSPCSDEIEISMFGSGFGESLVIHIGNNDWMVVDSCQMASTEEPAALCYLKEIGVSPDNVKIIVASHWDDDHIMGMSEIVKKCSNAEFYISGAVANKKFITIAFEELQANVKEGKKTGINEYYNAFFTLKERKKVPKLVSENCILLKNKDGVSISSLSPSSEVIGESIKSLIKDIEQNEYTTSISAPIPNHTSIVLLIEFGKDGILLGADMEEDRKFKGWSTILNNKLIDRNKSSVYKVAHHGSKTGDHPEIWEDLLQKTPISLIAPWKLPNIKTRYLPQADDISRIRNLSSQVYISSPPGKERKKTYKKVYKNKKVSMALERVKAQNMRADFNMIRVRKNITNDTEVWRCEIFGDAMAVE